MKKLLVIFLGILSMCSLSNAFTISFIVSLGDNFQTSDTTPTNGIDVSIITFNNFTPVAGEITFADIISNSITLVTGTTVSGGIAGDGVFSIPETNIVGTQADEFQNSELFAFANFGGLEFGLFRDVTGGTTWVGGTDNALEQIVFSRFDPITAFAGTYDNGSFILEAVPEPSTYALMALGGLALIARYGRKRRK